MTENQRDEILIKLLDETKEIKVKLEDNIKETKEIKVKLENNVKESRNISRCIAVMEVENGNKFSALFDAFAVNSEKIDEIQKDIKSIKTSLERHGDQIFCLKTKKD